MLLNNFLNKTITIPFKIIASIPSRLIYGNTIPLKHNLAPIIDKFKHNSKINKKSKIHVNGFVNIKYKADKNLIDKISNDFEKFVNDEKSSVLNRGCQKSIVDPIKKIPEIEKLIDLFKDEVLDYYNNSFYIHNISANRNMTHESYKWTREKYLYSNHWHMDSFKANKLKVFVLLNDNIHKESGATKVISNIDTKKLIKNFTFKHTSYLNKKFNNYVSENNLINYFEGNKGDIYIFNPQKCLHAASIPIKSKHRDLICFEVFEYLSGDNYIKKIDKNNDI